jgi:hypothetical protein
MFDSQHCCLGADSTAAADYDVADGAAAASAASAQPRWWLKLVAPRAERWVARQAGLRQDPAMSRGSSFSIQSS